MNVLQFVPHRFLSEMVKDALHALYTGFSMVVADDFETIFDKLPVVANQDVNEGSQAVKKTYPIIRKAYSSVAKVMGSAPSIQECSFKKRLSIVKASNGPIDFNHQVANPRHTPVRTCGFLQKSV